MPPSWQSREPADDNFPERLPPGLEPDVDPFAIPSILGTEVVIIPRLVIRGLLLSWILTQAVDAAAVIPDSERNALVAFYVSTHGGSWTQRSGWLGPPETECRWYGVSCDAKEETVLSLVLLSNGLQGQIPAAIAGLPNLQDLRLGGNELTGTIPPLANCTRLQILSLAGNHLTGSIPPLTGLTNLRQINLPGNELTGSIPSLNGLTSLEVLHLYDNRLTGSIPPLAGLTRLWNVVLSGNELTGSIPPLSGLPALELLFLSDNALTGSIPPLTELKALRKLALSVNSLTGNIPPLAGLVHLEELYLQANQLGLLRDAAGRTVYGVPGHDHR